VRAFAETPLLFEPSEEFFYSLCHDVLAAVVEVVSGMRFIDYLRVNLFDPLGMEGPGFVLTEEKKKRFSRQYTYSAETNTCKPCGDGHFAQLSPEYESGGGGLLCSADDYILLLSALSCGGRAQNGYEVLSEKSIDLMRQNTLNPKQTEYFVDWAKRLRVSPVWLESAKKQGRVAPCDEVAYRYGLGVRTLVNLSQNDRPVGEYGWDGAAGSYALVDPENRIAIFYAQHVLSCTPAFEVIQMKLRDMIYAAMSDVLNLTEP
jgi:CubicO group peptidase (beta-lactamase class C family)